MEGTGSLPQWMGWKTNHTQLKNQKTNQPTKNTKPNQPHNQKTNKPHNHNSNQLFTRNYTFPARKADRRSAFMNA